MAWQDELVTLDNELSSGRITADEHRRRRDEILAAASSSPVAMRRVHRQQPTSIANAFSPDTQATTEVRSPSAPGQPTNANGAEEPRKDDASRPPAWVATSPTVTPPTGPGLVTSAAPVPGAPAGGVPQGPAAWPAPVPPPGQPGVAMQGGEVFQVADARPRRRRLLVTAVAIVLVAALGVWWLVLGPGGGDPAPSAPQPQRRELSLDQLPNPTDRALSTSGVLTVDQAQLESVIKPDEAAYLSRNGVQRIYYRGVNARSVGYQLFAFSTASAENARTLAANIASRGKQLGMSDTQVAGVPAPIRVTKVVSDNAAIFEAVYASGDAVVRIVVGQTDQVDEQLITTALKHSIDVVTEFIGPN